MWRYNQGTGQISYGDVAVGVGYSGHAEGRNNPDMQDRSNIGPLPRGVYSIQPPVDTVSHGPYVLRLEPEITNVMLGRSGFLIHGDNIRHDASQGCVILPRSIREQIWRSGDHCLEVYAEQLQRRAA